MPDLRSRAESRKKNTKNAVSEMRSAASDVARITKNKKARVTKTTNGSNSAVKKKLASAVYDAGVYGENKKPKDYRRKK